MKSTAPKSVATQLFLRRSTFEKTSTKQSVEMFKLTNWTMTRGIKEVMHSHTSGLIQTQIIEDIFGQQKKEMRCQARQGLRRPVASWCAALAANVLTERHAFREVSSDTAMFSKDHKLAPEMFKSSRLTPSLCPAYPMPPHRPSRATGGGGGVAATKAHVYKEALLDVV